MFFLLIPQCFNGFVGSFLKVCCVLNELGHWSTQTSQNVQVPHFTTMDIIIEMVIRPTSEKWKCPKQNLSQGGTVFNFERNEFTVKKKAVGCFFLGLIVFMGCSLACVNILFNLKNYTMGSDWLAAPVWCDWLNRLTSLTLAACALGCIVEKAVVNIAYQFEPGWDAEDIS